MEFKILGPLELVGEGDRPLPLGGAKQRALLAILLLNGNEVVSADKLIDDIWGELPPSTAANALQVYVSQLRKILRSGQDEASRELIATRTPGYALQTRPSEIDISRFEELSARGRAALVSDDLAEASVLLRSALAVWRGPALADFTYEPFAQPHIERLEEMRLAVLEDRIEADMGLGRHVEVVPELELAVAASPHRERFREHLMLALYRSGRQAEALQTYEETRLSLADQLGIDPSPPLQRLYGAILRQDPSLEFEPQPEQAAASVVSPSGSVVEVAPPVGSTREAVSGDQVLRVTVLFADVVGSTSLGERLSPDEVRAVIGECLSRMSRVVEDFGGIIQAYMGDGICAYFGVPEAHEDDVERAARAALRIRRVVSGFAQELEAAWVVTGFSVRMGINTGRTVVALVGANAPQELAFGDSMNVAARLQSSADPGSILVGGEVAQRLASGFTLKQIGDLTVKGRVGSVEAWELLGAVSTGVAPEATPLVGRERELDRAALALDDLEAGRGQVMVISGDAGIGKSRMVSELRARFEGSGVWLEGGCRAFGGELPAWPVVEILRSWLRVTEDDPPVVVRLRLREMTQELLGDEADEVRSSLARFLAVDHEAGVDGSPVRSSAVVQEPIARALSLVVARLVARGPAVLVLEDIHDASPDTLSIMEELARITEEGPLLVILSARPVTNSEGWRSAQLTLTDYRHRAIELQLESLSDEDAALLIDALAPTGTVDPVTTADLVARAAGNPLYIEELLRLMIDSGGFQRSKSWTITASSSMVLLPPALESLLVSRIQHLPPVVRALAQAAAVIGQDVPATLLEDVAGAVEVHAGIGTLLRSEILRERRRYPEMEYAFKHPLLKEATLSTLTPARVRELSGLVATAMEARGPEPTGNRLERIAYHYYRSDDPQKALHYLELAGEQAIKAGSFDQAEQLLIRAKKVAARLADPEAAGRLARLASELPASAD